MLYFDHKYAIDYRKGEMIQDKMKTSQSRQKSYHDKRRKALEFQEGDHVFLRVTQLTSVGRALKSKKLTPHIIGPYHIHIGLELFPIGWHCHHLFRSCMMFFMHLSFESTFLIYLI